MQNINLAKNFFEKFEKKAKVFLKPADKRYRGIIIYCHNYARTPMRRINIEPKGRDCFYGN